MEVLTSKGFKSFDGIRISQNDKKIKLTFNDNSELKCTYDHLLQLANGEFKTAEELNEEDILWNNIQLVDKVFYEDDKPVYDLVNVEETSAYITNNVVSHNCLYIDEVAFIQESVFSEFFRSVYPTISSSKKSKIILVSTPNGDNFFHTIWKKAKDGVNGYVPFQVNWWDVPGRDEKWKEEQIAATDEITFNQEFGCDFNTTTTTLIPYDKINYIETNAIKPINFNNSMKIYKNPQKNHTYVLSCDVADQGIDFSVVTVIDITEYPWEQVCVYRENISYIMFPPVIMHIASMYNNGYVLVENNDVGKTILHVLNYEYELENIISTSVASGRGRPSNRYELGQRTTIKTKALGCSQFKQLVVSNKIKINNDWTIQEIKHFSVDSKGSYSSDTPTVHDDCVMTLVNFSYFSTTPTYKLLFDKDVGEDIRAEEERMIEESLLPLPMESRNINDSEWTADEIKWVNQ